MTVVTQMNWLINAAVEQELICSVWRLKYNNNNKKRQKHLTEEKEDTSILDIVGFQKEQSEPFKLSTATFLLIGHQIFIYIYI